MHTLYEGAILAVIVVFLFLRDWRATIIAALTLPLSIFPAFWVMELLGFSLNMVTLLAITLSTGILVDDAIVEIENIVRHIRMGKSPYQAALEAADEIGLAVIAISLAIVAVFIPASFMPSVPGQFFKQFGITVSVQVLFSLLCARMITPMLAAYFLRPHQHEEKGDGPTMRLYTRLVTGAVRYRFITVVLGLLFFAASLAGATLLPSGFLPVTDTARSMLGIELPPGSQLSDTESVTDTIVNRVRKRPEVASVFVDGGRIPNGAVDVGRAGLTINYVPKSKRSLSQQQLEQAIGRDLADIPDIRYWFVDDNGQRNVKFIVTGQDNATVANVASELAAQMRRLPIVANVVSGATLNRPELRIYPRRDLAVRLGVSTESPSETIRVATIGDVGPALAKFDAGDRTIPIRVLLEENARADRQVLEQIRIPSQHAEGRAARRPRRHKLRRRGHQYRSLRSSATGQRRSRFDRWGRAVMRGSHQGAVGDEELPPGIMVSEGGDAELQAELFEGFGGAMRSGLLMVYVVLAVLFTSLLQPVTILFSLPLSIAGAILALLITNLPITTPWSLAFSC
jgi:multidrug efflux pump subunit AcrB